MVKKFKIRVNGREYEIEVEEIHTEGWGVLPNTRDIERKAVGSEIRSLSSPVPAAKASGASAGIKAPMPGVVVAIKVKPGDTVGPQDVVITIEAMKMENEITAGRSGVVDQILVAEGDTVQAGQVLITLK
ncbi:biotin/lipoyl-containing protein [Carboxydothermus hydrogenoformans]|uniref:Biotin carboxyl carrier protein n=1 Tax=Carboxydothermus hydrogenoformans (strain ATCC BAA-161 / DSM 6008 / Z-2901) TaxID=246194 RepID=Q3ADL8_CARHZ|nr:biotin/lipoyl-containing protein [Carboxydothermus hydrogenoformans]ABB15005.1 biotin carboxyl carrier protein [Carboxydothermus hydrogenoformans Z-2901]